MIRNSNLRGAENMWSDMQSISYESNLVETYRKVNSNLEKICRYISNQMPYRNQMTNFRNAQITISTYAL